MIATSEDVLDDAQKSALEMLRRGRSFLLIGHERPDGDCIGSQGALAQVLRRLGKEVAILNPDAPQAHFGYLLREGPYGVFDGVGVPAHEICVLLDFNVLSRAGALADALAAAPSRKMIIDHHPLGQGQEPWWDEAFVDVHASATGILVYRIARLLGVEVDGVIARSVFTSLVTDTGWFRYSNTDAETLATAAELVARGADPAALFRSIYQRTGADEPRAIGALLQRTELFAEGRLAVVDLPLPEPGGPELEDGDAVLDILRAVESVEVVLFVREREPGVCKLSARSKTDYDVNLLAREFGGGGHAKAAGATIPGALADVRARLIDAALSGLGR